MILKEKVMLFKDIKYVYLANLSDMNIESLVYSTYSSQYRDDDTVLNSGQPFFQIENIPARSYLELEKIDPYEEGSIHFSFEKITWSNGMIEKSSYASIMQVYGLKRTGTIDLNTLEKHAREKVLVKMDEPAEYTQKLT